jgi:hypothetical protein
MAGQEMPKVNDAALMAMSPQAVPQQAPQGQGISNLPAPNMQRMADGGIAGYEDDEEGMATGGMGGMFNFAQQSEPVVRMSGGGEVPRYNGKQNSLIKYGGAYGGGNVLPATSGYEGMGIGEFLSQAGSDVYDTVAPYLTPKSQEENVAERNKKRKKAQQEAEYAEKAKQMKGYKPMRSGDDAEFDAEEADIKLRDNPAFIYDEDKKKMVRNPNASKSDVVADKATPPKPSAGGTGTGGGKTKTKVEAPVSEPIVPYGQSKALPTPAASPYTPKTAAEARAEADRIAAPELAEIKESYKPFAEQFAQDRSRIEGREKNAVSDALIRAGLATMAGKSQFAMQNIGEGGLQGLNAYQEAQKNNEASRRALAQSEMLMSQAQRAEGRGARADAASLFAQAEKAEQASVQFQQKAQELESTKGYQQGVLEHYKRADVTSGRMADAAMVSAQNRGLGAASAGDKLKLSAMKTELENISKELDPKANPYINLPKNAADKARLVARRDQLRSGIAGLVGEGTIPSLPPTGSGGGDKILDFSKI